MFNLEKEFDSRQWSTRITDPKELLEKHVEFGNQGEHIVNIVKVKCLYEKN